MSAPQTFRPGYVDPSLREYLTKFRAYQDWADGGPQTPESEEIRIMMDRAFQHEFADIIAKREAMASSQPADEGL